MLFDSFSGKMPHGNLQRQSGMKAVEIPDFAWSGSSHGGVFRNHE